ncbi:MAG: choice-of-anchor D domain-containing protein [Myxococcota bacterium]
MLRAIGVTLLVVALAGFTGCSDAEGDGTGAGVGDDGSGSDGTGGPGNSSGTGGFTVGESLGVSATPNPLIFPNVALGSSVERQVTIQHTGNMGVVELSTIILEPASSEIEILESPPLTLAAPGDSLELTLVFSPTDETGYVGQLKVQTNVPTAEGDLLQLAVEVTTPAPTAEFIALPNPMDFGEVQIGTVADGLVQLIPLGSDSAQVTSISLQDNDTGEFTLVNQAVLPAEATPDAAFDIQLQYSPVDGGSDEALLVVSYQSGDEVKVENVSLLGSSISPNLKLFPVPVDFGWKATGGDYNIPLTMSNTGTVDLVVSSLELTGWSSSTLAVVDAPTMPLTLAPGEVATVKVNFQPTLEMEQTTGPIGGLYIESNAADGAYSQDGYYTVSIFGRAEAPLLVVTPPDSVDFSFVAQGLANKRTVTLSNQGSAPLTVESVTIINNPTGEFEIITDESWAPLGANPGPAVLEPGELRSVQMRFSNDMQTAADDVFATLQIVSDDGSTPEWTVDLVAHRTDSPTCEIQLSPAESDFGIVPRGFTKTVTVNMTNIGSGPCSFDSAFVNDCEGWLGFFGTSCPDPSTTIQSNGDSVNYQIVTHPPAFLDGLKPGEVHEIKVMFTPPDTAPLLGDELFDYGGFLGVRVIDPYPPSNGDTVIFPKPQGSGPNATWASNLHARSGMAELTVFPGELDFGQTTLGCHSQTLELTACNVGNAPLDLTDVELEGCSIEFKQKQYPGLPVTMQPSQCESFTMVYAPQDLGGDACSMSFSTNDADVPSVIVPIEGSGVLETEQTDVFIQLTGQDVDVLFVIDDSGSMGEEQSNLASNFGQFINEASTWQNNYNVGVTTTDVDSDGGRFLGSPRIITPATWQSFQNSAQVGTSGSGTEKGLNAAQLALTLPNIADTSTACTADTDCAAPDACYDGFCGGPNRGFLRPDATLEVVFVSDEDDQSPADLNFYINFFKNIKGFYNSNLFHAHAIVGPPGGCSSSNGDATAGMRYIDLANATGGNVASICQSDFADSLASIGEIAFGLKTQFFLSRVAEPSTIEVRINGVLCTTDGGANWTYDATSNSVIFAESGGCMPQPDDMIEIYYETVCFLE